MRVAGRICGWRGVILAHAIYGGIYSDMAGGAGRGIIWRGRLYLLNGGAGARFYKMHDKVLDTLYIILYTLIKLLA